MRMRQPRDRAGEDGGRRSASRGRLRWRVIGLACLAWSGAACAETFLVLSLLGDHVTTVTEAQLTDSRTDANGYEVAPLSGHALDDFVVGTTGAAIEKAAPGATVTLLRASDPALYASTDGWLDVDAAQIRQLVSFVTKAVPAATEARLLLIAPYRAPPSFKVEGAARGSGSVAGLGFYVSSSLFAGENVPGFLGVFAHFQLLLIDVRGLAVLSRELVVVGAGHPASEAPDKNAWNALTMPRKVAALQELTQNEIRRLIPGMIGSSKR